MFPIIDSDNEESDSSSDTESDEIESDSEHVDNLNNEKRIERLRSLRENVNWEVKKERRKFLHRLLPLIENWTTGLPDLQDIFRRKEIDHILSDSVDFRYEIEYNEYVAELIFDFVARTGYRHEPDVDQDGNLLLHRTTPLHRAVRRKDFFAHGLFVVYNRYEANYTDEFGLTHFHAACMYGPEDTVEGFLEVVRNPNYLVRETGDSPLHLALAYDNARVVKFLLFSRADPNLANKEGLTPIHILSKAPCSSDSLNTFIEFCDKIDGYEPPHVNAQDKKGNTPLHFVMNLAQSTPWIMLEWLLRRGADPNMANAEGLTPLHVISETGAGDFFDKLLAQLFFKINLEMQKTVQVDAVDKFNRTPLQVAVVNFSRHMVDILLDQGADLSSFVFPAESHFAERLDTYCVRVWRNFKLKLASGAVAVVESLEKRGYELDQNDALTIMKLFAKHELFEKSADLDKMWNDDEEYAIEMKQYMVKPSLSFYDLIQLRPEEAEKVLTIMDYFNLTQSSMFDYSNSNHRACVLNLCEKVSRRFFRSWALESFVKLIHYRLPTECCSMIIGELTNEDLYNICLAVTSQTH